MGGRNWLWPRDLKAYYSCTKRIEVEAVWACGEVG